MDRQLFSFICMIVVVLKWLPLLFVIFVCNYYILLSPRLLKLCNSRIITWLLTVQYIQAMQLALKQLAIDILLAKLTDKLMYYHLWQNDN